MTDKSKEIKVTKIVLKIGEKELTLTLEEAKSLLSILQDALGGKPFNPYWYFQSPIYYLPYWTVTTNTPPTNSGDITIYCQNTRG